MCMMQSPLLSVSGVRVSLQVITMHPINLGAWDLCSWCVAAIMEGGTTLFPDCVRVQFCDGLSALDVLVQDRRHVRFRHFGVPGSVWIDDDGRPLLAGAEARRAADEDVARGHALLHEACIRGHEEAGCSS